MGIYVSVKKPEDCTIKWHSHKEDAKSPHVDVPVLIVTNMGKTYIAKREADGNRFIWRHELDEHGGFSCRYLCDSDVLMWAKKPVFKTRMCNCRAEAKVL